MSSSPRSWIRAILSKNISRGQRKLAVSLVVGALIAAPLFAAPQTAEQWFQQGNSQYQDGDIDAAMVSLRKAIELKKDYVDAFVLLGNAYLENGNFQKAIPALKRASELKPTEYAVLSAYSTALEGAGQTQTQIPVLGKLFKLNPADLVVGIKYLTLIEQVGADKFTDEHIEVLAALIKAPNPDPSYAPKLAKAYAHAGKSAQAAEVYGDLVKKNPDAAEYWIGLARAQATSNPSAAKPSYDKAILLTENAGERAILQKEQAGVGAASETAKPVEPIVADKASADKAAADKASAEKLAAEKAAADKLAAEKAAAAKLAADKAAADKASADKAAADKASAEKLAAEKAAADKLAADKAAAAKLAADKAAADKASADKAAADKASAEKLAAEKAAADKLAADKAAADKASADKAAADKASAEKLAAEKAAAEKLAAEKAAADKRAAEKLAAEKAALAEAKKQAELQAKAEAERKAQARKDSLAMAQAEKARKDSLARAEMLFKQEAARLALEEKNRREQAKRDSIAQAQADKRLRDSLVRVEKMRVDSVARAEKAYRDSLIRAEAAYKDSLAKAEKAQREALILAEKQAKAEAARQALLEKQRQDSVARAEKRFQDSIARVEKFRADSLLRAEKARLDSMTRVEALARAQAKKDSAMRAEEEKRVRLEAERKAKEEAARLAKEEADRQAKEKAEAMARAEAERKTQAEKEKAFQDQIVALVSGSPAKIDTADLQMKIMERRSQSKAPDPKLLEAEGILAFKQWNFALAVETLRKPKTLNPLATRLLAMALTEQGEHASALKEYAKVPDTHVDRETWTRHIKSLAAQKQGPKAAQEYEAYLAKYPDSDEALIWLIGHYRLPLQKDKLLPKLEIMLARTPNDAGLLAEIVSLTEPASPKAIEYRERYLKQNPDDIKAKHELAGLYEAKGRNGDALKIYQEIAPNFAADKAFNLKVGEMLVAAKKPTEAVPFFEAVANLDGNNKKLLLRVAALHEEIKQPERALEFYNRALALDPKDTAVQAKVAQLAAHKGKDAQREALLRIADGDAMAHAANFELAKSALAEGDKERAYAYLAKAIKVQPANPQYQAMLPDVVATDAQVAEHLASLEKAASQPGAKPELILLVAKSNLAKKNVAGAARWYGQLYSTSPKWLEGQREAIVVLAEAKNLDAAGLLAERYLVANPQDKEVRKIQLGALMASPKGDAKLREVLTAYWTADPEGAAPHLLRLAELDLAAKDIPAAMTHGKAWLVKNPKDLAGHRFLASLLKDRQGEEDAYLASLTLLSSLDPAAKGRYEKELTDLLFARGDFEEANKHSENVLKSAPNDAALWYRAGEIAQKLRKEDLAKVRFGKAYAAGSGNANYARTYGHLLVTDAELKANLPLWKFLATQNPNGEERIKLAKALYLNDDFAGSAAQWEGLIKSDAGLAAKEPQIAESYLRSGQTGKARALYEERLKTNPEDLKLLEQVAQLYKQEGNVSGYAATLERIVKIDPKLKEYQLRLAEEKEKAKDFAGALENYDAWVSRHEADLLALKSMHRLSEQQKDTTRLLEALVRLTRQKNPPVEYKRQIAEIDYRRTGNVKGVESQVKTDPAWSQGRSLLAHEYLKKGDRTKLLPFVGFLEEESKRDASLFEPLGDIYALQKKAPQANSAYLQAVRAEAKDRALFDKANAFAKQTASPTQTELLKLGVANYPDDADLKLAYAKSLGKTQAGLEVYQQIVSKDPGLSVLEQAVDLAVNLQRYALALQWLDIWAQKEPGENKVWEQTLSVANASGNKAKAVEALEKLNALKPANKDYALALAKAYEEQNKPEKAVEVYKRLLGMDAKNRPVLLRLLALSRSESQIASLRDILLQVDQADPAAHEAQFQLAKLFAKDGDKERSYGYLNKALRNQPMNAEYQSLLPEVVVTEGQVADHLPAIERLAAAPGSKPELQLLAARGNLAKKNSAGAARWYAQIFLSQRKLLEGKREPILSLFGVKNYQAAGALADSYLANDPKDREIRNIQVTCLQSTAASPSKMREALSALVEVDSAGAAKHLLALAELDLAAKDTLAALEHGRAWVKNNPKDLTGHRFLYPLLKGRAGHEEAYLATLIALSNLDASAKGRYDVELANLHMQRGDFEEAQKLLVKAVQATPGDASLWSKLGECETKLRKEESAKARYQKAYALAPGNAAYARTYGALVQGEAEIKSTLALWRFLASQNPTADERRNYAKSLFLNGDFAGSALQWDWFVRNDPQIGVTEPMVAESFLRSGQTARARTLYEERLKTTPDDLKLLEQIAQLYKQENNNSGYVGALERIVKVDPKYKNYQLLLAQEKEKVKDYPAALEAYDAYVSRNEGDVAALRAMERLSEQQKDTTRLMEALVRLTRQKNADSESKRKLAEIDYAKNGNLAGVERLVKVDKGWSKGKSILVRAYLKKGDKVKLLPFADFLQAESRRDSELLEPLGDLYALQKKTLPANNAYVQALRATPKDRELFDKVRKYALANKSPFVNEILRLGYQNFPDDYALKRDYAASLGKVPAALDVYAEIIAKESDVATLAKAVDLAVALQRWAQAFAWIEKWGQMDAKDATVWARMLDAAEKTSNRDKQRQALTGWVNNVPASGAKQLLKLAQLDLGARDTAAALDHGKQWLSRNPKDLEGLRFVYPMVKNSPAEKDTYLRVLQGLSEMDKAAAGRYDLELGALYFERGEFEEAQKILSKAVVKNSGDAALWYRLGDIERKLRREESAATRYRKAYELAPGNAAYGHTYGETVTKPEALKATLSLWRFLSTQNPSMDERRKLAQSLYLNGDYVASAAQWDWFVKADPNIGQTEPMVSESYLKSGQTAKARGIFEARLKTDPNNVPLLEQIAGIYKQESNAAGYRDILGRLVQIDPKLKNYQLLLAQEKEKAKDFPGALEAYDAWVSRNEADMPALKSMHRLSEQQKDTTRLMEALVRLNRQKTVEPQFRYQIVHIDYLRTGNIVGVERMVKAHGDWREGKILMVKHYAKQGALAKLVPMTPFVNQLAAQDKAFSEILGDLYAFQKKKPQANEAYLSALIFDKKDKGLFDKAYKYAKETDSPYRGALLKQGYDNFPDDVDIKYDFAQTLGKTQRALDLYQEILGRDRNRLEALRNASEIAVALRRTDVAAGLLQQWAQAEPNAVRPWILLVELYTQARKDDKLAEAQGKVSELTPKSPDLAFQAGLTYKKIGQKERALEYFTRASALSPQNGTYAKEFGLALFAAGQKDKAKAPLLVADKAIKMDENINFALYQIYLAEKNRGLARERLRSLNSLRPTNTQYGFALARLESEMQAPAEVVRILERPSLKDSLDAEMSFMLLDGYFKTGQKERAALWAPVLLRKFPTESRSSLPLGILFYETKNRAKAKEILEAYTRSNSSEEASYYLGRVYFEERNWSKAIDAFNQAGEFKADIPEMLGESYIQNKQPESAIAVYEKLYAKSKDPKVLTDLYALYKKTNDTKGLISILERILQTQPANLDYRVELAELYRLNGDAKRAEVQFDQILKKSPAHPGANLFMGMALAERKDYARAVRMLEIGTARYPDTLRAWKLLAEGYRSQNKDMQALQAYKRVLKAEPNNLGAAIARMELTQTLRLSSELPDAYSGVIKLDSNNLEAGAALAQTRYSERRYRDAAALYGHVVQKKSDSKEIWANYGISLLELGVIPEAKRALQRAVDLGAKDMRILTSLARIYKEEGNVEKAESLLNEMVKKDPRNHMAWYELGRIASDRNQDGVAESNFKKALQLAPATPDYSEALARLYFSKDDFEGVLRTLDAIHTTLTESGRLIYGEALMKQGKSDAALAEFNTLYNRQKSPRVLAKLAELKVSKGQTKEAMRLIEESGFSSDSTVQYALAKAYVAEGEGDKARDVISRLLSSSKYNAALYHLRGMSYYQDHNCGKAKKDFDQALKYNPDYMESVFYTGMCLYKEGENANAQNYFKELSQHSTAQWSARGFMGMGLVFESDKKMEAAQNYLQKAIAAAELPEAYGHLARIDLKMRKPADAERMARKALELQPDEPVAVGTLGEVLVAQNRKNEALALIKKSLQENPNSCPLLTSSAKINYAAGNYETSRQNGLYAISLCPDEALPYLYVGLVADKKYNKKDAKDSFKKFKKHGGDETLIPSEYR